jgi:peptidyl-prolyl cis-trans isomerase C
MKLFSIAFAVFIVMGSAQTPPAAPPKLAPDTVIATVDGKKLTFSEAEKYLKGLPPQMQQSALRNRKQFIQQYALMQRLSEMAEKAKLEEKSPYKESLAFNRMNILTQAQINEIYDGFSVHLEDEQKYYDENKSRYEQIKLKVIYIPFSSNPASPPADGKKRLSEEEAKAKAEQLVKEIKGGADFVKVVKENSEDAASKAKDGDFGSFSRTDKLPESISSVVFGLKTGEVSEPVRQPNGFYIFRAESVSQKPLSEVNSQIITELKNARLKEFLDATTKSLNITFDNEQYFSPPAATSLPTLLPAK